MTSRDLEGRTEIIEELTGEAVLFALKETEGQTIRYPSYDVDLDEEFDAIRSIN